MANFKYDLIMEIACNHEYIKPTRNSIMLLQLSVELKYLTNDCRWELYKM